MTSGTFAAFGPASAAAGLAGCAHPQSCWHAASPIHSAMTMAGRSIQCSYRFAAELGKKGARSGL
jgi:hypothetical protein